MHVMRRGLLFLISMLALVFGGCTASDRDYVRNHIVLLERAAPADSIAASSRAGQRLVTSSPTTLGLSGREAGSNQ